MNEKNGSLSYKGNPYQRSAAMVAKREKKQRQKLLINVLTGNAVGSALSSRQNPQPHPPPSHSV